MGWADTPRANAVATKWSIWILISAVVDWLKLCMVPDGLIGIGGAYATFVEFKS